MVTKVRAVFRPKRNSRYFCACALKKSPKHGENIFQQKSYFSIIENRSRRSECQCQMFDWSSYVAVSAHAQWKWSIDHRLLRAWPICLFPL